MEQEEIQSFLQDLSEVKGIVRLTKETDIVYLEKRTIPEGYDPTAKFDFDLWREALTNREIETRYERLHEDLLYTNEKQKFSEALAVFEQISTMFINIDE